MHTSIKRYSIFLLLIIASNSYAQWQWPRLQKIDRTTGIAIAVGTALTALAWTIWHYTTKPVAKPVATQLLINPETPEKTLTEAAFDSFNTLYTNQNESVWHRNLVQALHDDDSAIRSLARLAINLRAANIDGTGPESIAKRTLSETIETELNMPYRHHQATIAHVATVATLASSGQWSAAQAYTHKHGPEMGAQCDLASMVLQTYQPKSWYERLTARISGPLKNGIRSIRSACWLAHQAPVAARHAYKEYQRAATQEIHELEKWQAKKAQRSPVALPPLASPDLASPDLTSPRLARSNSPKNFEKTPIAT